MAPAFIFTANFQWEAHAPALHKASAFATGLQKASAFATGLQRASDLVFTAGFQ